MQGSHIPLCVKGFKLMRASCMGDTDVNSFTMCTMRVCNAEPQRTYGLCMFLLNDAPNGAQCQTNMCRDTATIYKIPKMLDCINILHCRYCTRTNFRHRPLRYISDAILYNGNGSLQIRGCYSTHLRRACAHLCQLHSVKKFLGHLMLRAFFEGSVRHRNRHRGECYKL